MRRPGSVALVVLVIGALALAARGDGVVTDAERTQRLSEQLRCPVCDGLAVADSPSSTARAIAADVRARVAAGESDDQIRSAYVNQYGEWILLEPPGGGFGMVAWAVPIGLVVVGIGGAAWVLRRRASGEAPTQSERAVVAEALARGAR